MTCNMSLAELQTKLDRCQNATLAADYQWSDVSRQLSHRTLVLGRISMLVASTYLPRDAMLATDALLFSVFSRPRSEGWPHHGRTFSIHLCPSSL